MPTELLTAQQAADLLGMSKTGIYGLVYKRQIPFYKPNKRLLYFRRDELIDWATLNRSTPDSELEATAATKAIRGLK